MSQKEGENDIDGYVKSEPPLIRNLYENYETVEDDFIDGSKHHNGCSDPDEGGDATNDSEDEDGRDVRGFYNYLNLCLSFRFWLQLMMKYILAIDYSSIPPLT